MDRLWAPWRMSYLKKGAKGKGCIFCLNKAGKAKRHVFLKTKHSLGILNIYPYNNGHVMVAPFRHTSSIRKLSDKEIVDLFRAVSLSQRLLDRVLKPQGYNIGINESNVAGAGITAHVHIHIVPRWKGDTNFMPALYATKVISQSLDELLKRLKSEASRLKQHA